MVFCPATREIEHLLRALCCTSKTAVHIVAIASRVLEPTPKVLISKGQITSKGFLMSLISSKKPTEEFDFTTMIPQVDLFSIIFWKKSKTSKNLFEII